MTDKEALEHILGTADDFIKAFGDIPVDSINRMARHTGKHITGMIAAVGAVPNPESSVMIYATAIAGLVLKLKVGSYARALLAAEEAANDT